MMKINIGRKKKDRSDDLEYIYENYRPAKNSVGLGSYPKNGVKEYKWVIQLLVSGAVLLLVAGLFKSDLPFTGTIKEGIKYLMTSETNIQPVINQVIRLSNQVGNVDWPMADDMPAPVRPAIATVPSESVLILPVSGNVLRGYGWNTDPQEELQRFNEGIDIAVPLGTDVKASTDGKVIKVNDMGSLGKAILIESEAGELIRYANLSQTSVQMGQTVKAGDIVGKSGMAADKEPYVHFEVIIDGRPIDPLNKLGIDFTRINGASGPEQK